MLRTRLSYWFSLTAVLAFAIPSAADEHILHRFAATQLTETYFSEGVAVGDINGDGHNDVVYGPYWFAGPEFSDKYEIFPAQPQPMERYANHFFAWVYDFDSDGRNDVFTVGFPGTPAYVYQNPGDLNAAWTKHEVFDWVSNESPQFTNIVGDARPELICTRDGFFGFATVDWQKPFSAWKFHPVSEQTAASKFGHGLGIGDVNGDGRLDILHTGGWYEQPAKNPLARWKPHVAKFARAGGAEMYAYDVDGDGDNDIITSEAAHEFGLSWYEQLTAEDEPEFRQHTIMGQHASENKYGVLFSELHSVALADMDGDGLKDIVTGKTYWSHHKQSPMWDAGAVVYWFQLVRTPEGVDWIPRQIDAEAGIGRQVTVADINSDGLPDVATGGMLGANVMLQSREAVTEAEFVASLPAIYTGPKLPQVQDAVALRGPRISVAADGKVPQAIEAENLNAQVSGGATKPQPMGNFPLGRWSGDSQLWWTGGKPGDHMTIQLDALRDVAAVQLAMTAARDYAVVQIALDGEIISPEIDLYSPDVVSTGLLEFKTPQLTRGKHQLTLTILGANPKAATAYMLGLDFIRFRADAQEFDDDQGIKPRNADGSELNLDFEAGDLSDWEATGDAFVNQPIEGDTVAKRRKDMSSRHLGKFWIGGFESAGDKATGTLTSQPFAVKQRFATFLIGGGSSEKTRVELWSVGDSKPFYSVSGRNEEDLREVVVDLRRVQDGQMFIRLVDESRGGWGHLNFDHFRLHATRPGPLTPALQQLAADEYPYSGLAAEAAAAAMQVPEGFRVSVCASEPDVKQPIAMALDDRGRTWIAEAYEYPQRAEGDTGRDRILIFEDTTGDGKFDSRKVFAEGLNLVSGLEVGFGGVWVGAAPYLMFIPDANADDKADSPPQILLDGWGYQDTHETLNTFCWGPDGWLYGCHGVFTHSNVGKPGATDDQRTRINAGVWRYHPTRHEFDVLAHGTSNPWGVDFNQYGDAFITACVIPHLYHMIPEARYQRQGGQHFNPHTYDDIKTIADHLHYLGATPHSGNGKSDEAGGGHAHAGAMIYQGGLWPDEYAGKLFMNNIHGQRLNVDVLHPEGSGYSGGHAPDFLLTGDAASQILNMRYGPDGQVIFIDWYDMQACHRREVEVHDRSNGRIYKISYGETEPVEVDLTQRTDLELAELCLDKNDWYVRHSRRLLQERAAAATVQAAAVERLRELATSHDQDHRRLRAAWALHATGQMELADYGKMLSDPSPYVRVWALRLFTELQGNQFNERQMASLTRLASEDDSPIVRREIASVLCKLPPASRWETADVLLRHAEDANDHNLPLLYWYAIEPLADVDPDRALALGMTAGEYIPLLRQFMLRRVAGSGGEQAIERLVTALQKTDDKSVQTSFLSAIRSSLSGSRTAKMPAGWPAAFETLVSAGDNDLALAAAAIGVVFGDSSSIETLRDVVADRSYSLSQRLDATSALLAIRDPGLLPRLLAIVGQRDVEPLQIEAAIRALAEYDSEEVPGALTAAYQSLTPGQRRAAIATLCARTSNAQALLREIAADHIPAADLSADLARQLEYLGDDSVSRLLAEHWGQVRESSADKAGLMQEYKQLIASKEHPAPDLPLGRAIFAKTCQRCHMLYGVGEKLGPDLTGSNRANLDYLLENIVDPSAVMAKEYRQSVFLTDSGQVVTGVVRSETGKAVTVQTAEALVVIPVEEIEERRESDLSMMPENQLKQFSETEIRSLIAYLRSKRQTPLKATPETVGSLFNGQDLTGWTGNPELWSVSDGQIIGRSNGLKKNEFLVSDLSAGDFKLSLEIMLVDNAGNSGIQFRSQIHGEASVAGYQADVGQGWWGKLYEEHGRGLLWDKSGEAHVKLGDWNLYEIQARGSKITTTLNGKPCVDLDDPTGQREGIFAIQLHSGGPTEVRVRNLQLEVP